MRDDDPGEGLAAYEAERRPRAGQVQLQAREQFHNNRRNPAPPPLSRDWIFAHDATVEPDAQGTQSRRRAAAGVKGASLPAYEVMPGNTADCTTLPEFLRKIEAQYGKAERIRGHLGARSADPPIYYYLVGTPKGRLSKLEKALLGQPWQAVREGVEVKLLPQDSMCWRRAAPASTRNGP